MRNFENERARQLKRASLRRAYRESWWDVGSDLAEALANLGADVGRLHSMEQALDVEMLLPMVAQGTSAPCNVLRNRIVMRYLRDSLGVSPAAIAAAFHLEGEELERALSLPLLAPPAVSAAIEQYLEERYVETPEPDRYVAPTGARAIPGERYPLSVLPGGRTAP